MALRDLKELQRQADALSVTEKVELANYLLKSVRVAPLKATGDLSEFAGSIRLSQDPVEFQQGIRAEWP